MTFFSDLYRTVTKISTRIRTFSDASRGSAPSEHDTPSSPVKGIQPKSLDVAPGTPILRQKSEIHTKEEKEAEALKKQLQEKNKEEKLIKAESVETGNVNDLQNTTVMF